jgi:hypothetical protein
MSGSGIIKNYKNIIFLTAVSIIGIWLVSAFSISIYFPKLEDRGVFGDMFGAVNSLFTGLSLVGITFAIILQQKELSLQLDELIETRRELSRTALAQEKSEKSLSQQVEAQNLAVQLSALSSILSHYDSQTTGESGIDRHYAQESADKLLLEMKQLLEQIKKH